MREAVQRLRQERSDLESNSHEQRYSFGYEAKEVEGE
jgi:hypothetical protein